MTRLQTALPRISLLFFHLIVMSDKALDEFSCCGESFETVIDKIYIENIDVIEHSTIEFSFDLE